MKLLFVQEAFWPAIGGIEVLSLRALGALREAGHEVLVVTPDGDRDRPLRDDVCGIRRFRLPLRKALEDRDLEALARSRSEFSRLKIEFGPDVMQLNFSGPSGYLILATAGPDDPPFLMAVRHPLDNLLKEGDSVTTRLLLAADWVTGNSRSTLAAARAAAPRIEPRSSLIYNGLEAPTLQPRELVLDPPALLCLGRLVPDKGFHIALQAFALVVGRFPAARLVVAGDGPARGDLEDLARRLSVADAVDFVGWTQPSDVPETIDRASVVLMPSREESFGLVALEAALMARPVVASRVGGLAEVVRHGVTGLTVPHGDVEAMAEAVLRLLENPSATRDMGRVARRRALEEFSFARYVEQYDALYHRLARPPAGRRKAG